MKFNYNNFLKYLCETRGKTEEEIVAEAVVGYYDKAFKYFMLEELDKCTECKNAPNAED